MSTGGAPPSTLSDVLRYVRALLVRCGECDYPHVNGSGKTELLSGERYRRQEGYQRRILVIEEQEPGQLGAPLEIGAREVGSWTASATCYVWGAESEEDFDRYDDARRIVHRLIACFVQAGVGREQLGPIHRLSDTDIATFGEEYRFTVSYTWQVPRDAAVDDAARALAAEGMASQSPTDPDRPNGGTGQNFTIDINVQNER